MKNDIPLIILVALLVTTLNLIWQNLSLREHVSDVTIQLDYKQQEVENLVEANNILMRENLLYAKRLTKN